MMYSMNENNKASLFFKLNVELHVEYICLIFPASKIISMAKPVTAVSKISRRQMPLLRDQKFVSRNLVRKSR